MLYCVLRDKYSKDDNAPVDIIARAEDASKIQRIFDRFELGNVDKGSIVANAEKSIAQREELANEVPTKSKGERIVEEAMGKPIQKDGASHENPTVAKTDKNPPSRQSSAEVDGKSDKGISKSAEEKPSVREKLERYKAQAKTEKEADRTDFDKSGDKPNYYKTDAEIKVMLPDLKKGLLQAKNILELNEFADSYMVWSDILEEDNEDVLTIYKNGLNKMLKQAVRDGKEENLTHSYDLFHMSSDKVKIIYMEENENMKEFLIETYVEHLRITTHGEKAYQFSYKLRNYFSNSYYHEIIMTKVDQLYNKTSFPVGDVDQNRYHTCYNIMYLLYHADKEKFLNYCTDIKKDCDKMSRHRIEVLSEEIMKDQKT